MATKKLKLTLNTPEALKEYRRKHNLNQSEFWSRVGVTQSGGSRYESGRNIPRPVQILLQLTYGTPKQADEVVIWLRNRVQGTTDSHRT